MDNDKIKNELLTALNELVEAGKLSEGSSIVIGCSTSEVSGGRIGKASVPDLGPVIAGTIIDYCNDRGITPIFQCCEHLNRALVMEKSEALAKRYTLVCAVPRAKAGGSCGTAAWKHMKQPCLVMSVQADAGIDIGDTLIGMHLRPVAVPFRGSIDKIGEAHLVMAYSRLPYIGGERAKYTEED